MIKVAEEEVSVEEFLREMDRIAEALKTGFIIAGAVVLLVLWLVFGRGAL